MKLSGASLSLALCLLVLSGCGGTPKKDTFYRLPDAAGSAMVTVEDGPVLYIPPFGADGLHGERALIYAHDDGTTLEQYNYHYWVDSPRQLLQQALATHLRATHRIALTPSADAVHSLRGRIVRFERQGQGKNGTAEVELEFELLPADTDVPVFARRYARSAALSDDEIGSCAGALGRAAQEVLVELSTDLEAYWGH